MQYDVIIVGGGMVGLTLALALLRQTSLSIAILEAQSIQSDWSQETYHHRVSAFSLSSCRIFQSLDVWKAIKQKRVSPFTQIHVWDDVKGGDIHFHCQDIAEPVLGYIIENNVVQAALMEKITHCPQISYLAPVRLQKVVEQENQIEIYLDDARVLTAKLAIAADGANSWLRQQVGMAVNQTRYEQDAIVATVRTSLPHHNVARQVFLPTGPLAFLPLAEENLSSIVWSLPVDEARRLMAVSDDEFKAVIASAAKQSRAESIKSEKPGLLRCARNDSSVLSVEKRHAFPLQKQHATHYIKSRIALVGDAAHVVHPLAGQGVNMGLLDAASLVDVIEDALSHHRDFASYATLRKYERWRRADNQPMLTSIDLIKQLFASNERRIQSWRSFGLSMTNQFAVIKNRLTRQAVGNRRGLPRLAQSIF